MPEDVKIIEGRHLKGEWFAALVKQKVLLRDPATVGTRYAVIIMNEETYQHEVVVEGVLPGVEENLPESPELAEQHEKALTTLRDAFSQFLYQYQKGIKYINEENPHPSVVLQAAKMQGTRDSAEAEKWSSRVIDYLRRNQEKLGDKSLEEYLRTLRDNDLWDILRDLTRENFSSREFALILDELHTYGKRAQESLHGDMSDKKIYDSTQQAVEEVEMESMSFNDLLDLRNSKAQEGDEEAVKRIDEALRRKTSSHKPTLISKVYQEESTFKVPPVRF